MALGIRKILERWRTVTKRFSVKEDKRLATVAKTADTPGTEEAARGPREQQTNAPPQRGPAPGTYCSNPVRMHL